MKQRNLFLLFSLMIILTGCSAASHEESNNREPKYELTLESAIDQKDCFVCGNPPGGLLDYYSVCRETRSTYISRPGFRRKAKERVEIRRKESSPSTAIWPAFSDSWQQT